jgi:ribonucleotide monophosphatase NagD (HAD superfamily)
MKFVYMRVPFADGSENCFRFDDAYTALRYAQDNKLEMFMLTNYPEFEESQYEHIIYVPIDTTEVN